MASNQTLARLKLIGVFLIFLGPLALAYLMYYGLSYGGSGLGTNGGQLVSPAKPLPDIRLTDADGQSVQSGAVLEQDWTILQVAADDCDSTCVESLNETRQIRALLHRRAARVQRVLLAGADAELSGLGEQPDLSVYRGDLAPMTTLLQDEDGADAAGVVYLIDPLGNWMLYYPPGGDGEALFKDIKHLLKLSHIG